MGTSTAAAEPTVLLLGPVQVADAVATSAPRERALLARLAIDAGRTVGVDRLVDDLWGEDPPASARNALQVYVSHLRARLGRQAVVTLGGGYRLEVAPDQVDAHVFERLVPVAMGERAAGRAHDAVATLDAGLRLWRGEAMSDLTDYAFAVVEAARLRELRGTALEHLAEALLETGDLDRLTDRLAPALRDFPFRERLRAAVMTGLYRQGRAVDALALYAEVVDQLRAELGLEPGPTLAALQHAILNDSPDLAAPPSDGLPTGELTLLAAVLDSPAALEGRLQETYGDAVLAQRDLLRDAVAAHDGLTWAADGERLLAAFRSADEAVRAAVDAHRALAGHDFPDHADVRVRIGVHTGVPRVVDRHYVGTEVHRVEEVALAAAGGQTLATAATAAALVGTRADSDEDRVLVTDLGTHRLPHVALPERLHQVSTRADDAFAPPRTLGGRGNLPRTAVQLVGRADLLASLVDEVSRSGTGLTTLVGPGGTGKTRLAIEVARTVGATLAGGVYFVPLETARDQTDVWAALAAALDLPADSGGPTAVLAHLGGRRTLLVLDNLEQVVDVDVVLAAVLDADGDVTVLATSRRPTGVLGERLHRVDPLDDGADGVASELFARYAELARPGFVVDDANRDAVARICRRVDGLPLGIELAAARVRQLPPYALASALDEGLALVTAGTSRHPRQRDLHALTAWSVDLLPPEQGRLLELLAVFVGGVDLETVARLPVPDGSPQNPVTDLLALADASLVRVSDDDRPRVSLLETVREHALARLRASGREDSARDTHLALVLELARRLHPRTTTRAHATDVVLRERRNIESALAHAVASGPDGVEAAAEILTCVGEVWHQLGGGAFDDIQRVSLAVPADSRHRGWVTYWSYRRLWDLTDDLPLLLETTADAEATMRAAGDTGPLAALLGYGTDLGRDAGLGVQWGVDRAREAVELARPLGEDWLLAAALGSLARTLVEAGRPEDARRLLGEARAVAARAGDVHRLDMLTMTESQIVAGLGRAEDAWTLGVEGAAGLVVLRSDGARAVACRQLTRLASLTGRHEAAAVLLGITLSSFVRIGSVVSAIDHEHLRSDVAATIESCGEAEFDRLVAHGRDLSSDDAVSWLLDLLADAR
ncbi:AfsR/SARP family transcriptional regulator [Nocardioides baculatus]|uniref:Winged helix-turn-helix domain-containing protein n=1 Tax=Nocardioides baculatus TaxID=2801337 RepID=A0ABS1L5Q4_9ACTN|nr:BTAD domain-containing putative transcriptional regulator [Nocardioides baculatus]MBL0746888.1 winged helix-turn-helix domain-containing protein [Nocardioides baculatus]